MTNEGRRDPRKPTVLQIRFRNATIKEFLEKHSKDVSRGGIFIKMKTPFPSGTLIKFDIRIAKDSVIQGVGRVVWSRQRDESVNTPSGMGVKFIKLDDQSRILLEEVLAQKDPKEEADTPLFDDALPKPKTTVFGMPSITVKSKDEGSKPGLPKPSDKGLKGVSLREDTRKVPLATLESKSTAPPPPPPPPQPPSLLVDEDDEDEAETVVTDGRMMEEVLKMARQPSRDSSPPEESDPLLSGTKEEFVEDISFAISDALQNSKSSKKPAPRMPSPDEPKVKVEPSLQIPLKPPESVQNKRRNTGLFLGIIAAAIVGGVVFFGLFLKSPAAPPDEVSSLEPDEPQLKSATTTAPATSPNDSKEQPSQETVQQTLPGKTRTIKVETFPRDATVFIDGILQPGTTPLKLTAITAEKPVELTIHRFGFLDYKKVLEPDESEAYIKQDLQPATFTIEISTEPAGAKIIIDSTGYGTTPRTLKPNRFSKTPEIRLVKPGYATAIYSVIEADWAFDEKEYLLTISATLEPGSGPAPTKMRPSSSSGPSTPTASPASPTKIESETTDEALGTTPHTSSEKEVPGAGETPSPTPSSKPSESSAEKTPTVPQLSTEEQHQTKEKSVPEEKPTPEKKPVLEEEPKTKKPEPSDDLVPDEKPTKDKPTAPKEKAPSKSPPQPKAPSDGAPKTGKIDDNPF